MPSFGIASAAVSNYEPHGVNQAGDVLSVYGHGFKPWDTRLAICPAHPIG